ncbi:zinc finger protein, partial [Aphelenchoides avenae]
MDIRCAGGLSSCERPTNGFDCSVCGDKAWTKNFGAVVCRACAAFFRRSFVQRKQYRCKYGRRCLTTSQRDITHKTICRYCRLQRCFEVGMQAVPVNVKDDMQEADTPLGRIALDRKAIFLSRFRATHVVNGVLQNEPGTSDRLADCQQCSVAIRAEFIVLTEFLQTSGVLESIGGSTENDRQTLASLFLYTWQIYESAINTIRNFGNHYGRLYYLNDTYVDVNERSLELFYRKDPSITDASYAMRHGMEFYKSYMETIRRLAKARLDETEQAALVLILLVEPARKIAFSSGKCSIAALTTRIFRDLHKHYVQNYENVALRLDTLVQLAQEMQ